MFERFTVSARRAVALAQEEARTLDRPQIGTDHLLIALAGDGDDPAAQALRSVGATRAALRAAASSPDALDARSLALLGIDLDEVRRAAEERFGRGALDAARTGHAPAGHIRFSDAAKQSLAAAVTQAAAVRTGSISSGHLLLGVLADPAGAGTRVAQACGIDVDALRADVVAAMRSDAA